MSEGRAAHTLRWAQTQKSHKTWYVFSPNMQPMASLGAPHALGKYGFGIYMYKEEHSIGHVYAIKGVNKRDIHVAQSAFAQTKTINHK